MHKDLTKSSKEEKVTNIKINHDSKLLSSKRSKRRRASSFCTSVRPKRSKMHSIKLNFPNQDVLYNTVDVNHTNGFYGILSLFLIIASSVSVTHFSVNNVMTKPEYWYEIMVTELSINFTLSCVVGLEQKVLGWQKYIKKGTFRLITETFLIIETTNTVVYGLLHLLWSEMSGYYAPFPHRSQIAAFLVDIVFDIALVGSAVINLLE